MFTAGLSPPQVAARLRVSKKSTYAWQQAWRAGGCEALRSTGPASRPSLDDTAQARLADALDRGPAAHGWTGDQRWTLARVATLIDRLFGQSYTLTGVAKLLHRMGYTAQRPAHRAAERDEAAVEVWREEGWVRVKKSPRPAADGCASSTRPASR